MRIRKYEVQIELGSIYVQRVYICTPSGTQLTLQPAISPVPGMYTVTAVH